jgi:hypothetical protein
MTTQRTVATSSSVPQTLTVDREILQISLEGFTRGRQLLTNNLDWYNQQISRINSLLSGRGTPSSNFGQHTSMSTVRRTTAQKRRKPVARAATPGGQTQAQPEAIAATGTAGTSGTSAQTEAQKRARQQNIARARAKKAAMAVGGQG